MIKSYILNNKKDIIYSAIILTVMTVMFLLYGNNFYNIHSDLGRELYIPEQMIKGQVLYKDIYNIYAPLGYFLNVVFIKILGDNLRTFTYIGFFLSLLTLIPVYKITKKFCNSETALLLGLFTVFSCIYSPTLSNWITPYSYSVLYSLCSIMWALYFIFQFFERNQNKYIYYSSMLYGFSLASKYEYIGFALIILIVLIYKKATKKVYLHSFISAMIFPMISLTVLFIQHCSISDLSAAIYYIIRNADINTNKYFYTTSGFIPSKNSLMTMLHPTFNTVFSPICFLTLIITIISIIKKYDIKIIILNITALILSMKCFCFIRLDVYGTYFLPVLLISLCVFTSVLLKNKKIIFYIILIISILLYASFDVRTSKKNNFISVETPKGTLNVEGFLYPSFTADLNFIEKETNKDDKVLFIPEGVSINYLTDRESDNYLYYLTFPNCTVFQADMINNLINQNKIKYIVVDNRLYYNYRQTYFADSYGIEIYNNIKEHYNLYKTIETNFIKEIYIRNTDE